MKNIIQKILTALNLNGKDFLRALLLAMAAPLIIIAQQWIDALKNGVILHIDWKHQLMIAIGCGLAYILKQIMGFDSKK